jgi:hypothetical protein
MLGGKGKGGRVGQLESPLGTELSPCLRVANLQKIFFFRKRQDLPLVTCQETRGESRRERETAALIKIKDK